jgi:NADH-quinone oxidoreductase subunit M
VVAPLFFIIALLSERAGSEDIRDMGGIAFRAPVLATLFLVIALATLAIPGSANFAGEFLILIGLFNAKMPFALIASIGVAMASVYMLRMFIRAVHNRLRENERSFELTAMDGLVLVPLVLCIVAFAFYPQQALKHSEPTVNRVVAAAAPQAVAQREVSP